VTTGDLRVDAEKWIDDNPEAYDMFVRFALEMFQRGRSFGIGLLTERVRWECAIKTRGDDEFKINNNHRAYIARRLVKDYPFFEGYLTFRQTRY